ncbi:hypothetical protein ACP70R_021271 [Stipagrostis hirtigluma subsp. patula]
MSATTATGGGKPSRSSSAIVADAVSGYHILRIEGYSRTKCTPTGECLKSQPFTVGGLRWFIRYYPNGSKPEVKDYVSLSLQLDQNVAKAVKAQHQFRLVDQVGGKPLSSEAVVSFENKTNSGTAKFIKTVDLGKSEHLKDDSFAVRCDIAVVNEFQAKETDEAATREFISVPPSDLHLHLGDLLVTEKGTDVVFEVGGQTFAAHRCVLAARSPVFRAELLGTMKESDTAGVVHIDDMEAQVFKALLYFMYTDSLPKMKKKKKEEEEDVMFPHLFVAAEEDEEEEDVMSQHLLVAADKYNLERLKLMCEDKLCKYIDVGTVATILALAEQHHCHGLKKACFDFLCSPTNLRAVAATDGFKHLSRSCPAIMEELIVMLGNLVQ